MPTLPRYVDPVVRALMSALFLVSGLGKLGAPEAAQGYMAAFHVPAVLLWPTVAFELGTGVLVLIGLFTRPIALLLAGFSLVTALLFHTQFGDQIQTIMFLKNMAMTGGFLLLAKDGAQGFSVDALRARSTPLPA